MNHLRFLIARTDCRNAVEHGGLAEAIERCRAFLAMTSQHNPPFNVPPGIRQTFEAIVFDDGIYAPEQTYAKQFFLGGYIDSCRKYG